ncbi:MAG: von Willebrand factor type A domain-containing protein [Huintestinicola sp.]
MKKNMNKAASLTLTAIMTLSAFTGCGQSNDTAKSAADTYAYVQDDGYAATEIYDNYYTSAGNIIHSSDDSYKANNGEIEEVGVAEAVADEEYDMAINGIPEIFPAEDFNTEEYNYIEENGYVSAATSPLSTFSADVDTASYSNIRRMIDNDMDIPADAVRLEEMINYFNYNYPDPAEGEPFAIHTELSDCPWNDQSRLLMVGINTKSLDSELDDRPPMNLVFLIDVSGSMYSEAKLPLVQKSFSMLTDNLGPKDRISIVTYAGSDDVLLEGADGNDKEKILRVIDSLEAGGSTAGAAGINTAYEIAEKYFIDGGNNRIILATDGDLNVGISSESELTRLVEEKRENGVYLSVLGFGTGNYKDNKLEAIADHGNGNYSYIDSEREAKKVLVEEMSGTLLTVAKDVKFQLEFNPANVKGYRLIGYENRALANEDFEDDTKDAGEIGAGHSVTVLYEIVMPDSTIDIPVADLKYSQTSGNSDTTELLTVNIRYKDPDGTESKLVTYPVDSSLYSSEMSENMTFASAVAEFGMILRNSAYSGNATYQSVLTQLADYDYSDDEYKDEFIYLVKTMKRRG